MSTNRQDYKVTISRVSDSTDRWVRQMAERNQALWIVHCELCKHYSFWNTHARAVRYANEDEPRRPVHQRWIGRIALGGDLPSGRGYDHQASYQYVGRQHASWWERRDLNASMRANVTPIRQPEPPEIIWKAAGKSWWVLTSPQGRRREVLGTDYKLYLCGTSIMDVSLLHTEQQAVLNGRRLVSFDEVDQRLARISDARRRVS